MVPDLHLQGCGFESRPRLLCTNANSACHPYRVWQWVPASTGEWTGILRLMKCRLALPCGPKKLHKYTFSLQTIQQTCRLLVGMWAMLPVSLHCRSHYNFNINIVVGPVIKNETAKRLFFVITAVLWHFLMVVFVIKCDIHSDIKFYSCAQNIYFDKTNALCAVFFKNWKSSVKKCFI